MAPLLPSFPTASQPESTNQSQSLAPIAAAATAAAQKLSTTPDSRKAFSRSPHMTPQPLTAAAALADERAAKESRDRELAGGTTSNPAAAVLSTLQGLQTSPARMADMRTAPSHATAGTTPSNQPSEAQTIQSNHQTSPTSMSVSSAATAETDSKPTVSAPLVATAMPTAAHDSPPSPTDTSSRPTVDPGLTGTSASHEGGSRAYTFPPPPAGADDPQMTPIRNMSLPNPGFSGESSRTGSGPRRHKCPYCATDFTRHHNLKSHLLTHSQEKPYGCDACSSRFRRLHDLKRHQKLHTGERPHICNKCGRKFARGDALARHNKGQGGCAGRRSSFGGPDGDGMEGVEYTAEPENMDDSELDPERRRDSSFYTTSHGPSTYPPLGSHRGSTDRIANMYGPSRDASYSSNAAPLPAVGQAVFAAQGIAESPKPISPGLSTINNHRTNSLLPSSAVPAKNGYDVESKVSELEATILQLRQELQQYKAENARLQQAVTAATAAPNHVVDKSRPEE